MKDNIEIKKECFGKWVYESIECMQCKYESQCQYTKQKKQADYARANQLKRHPECDGCYELIGTLNICHKDCKHCLGDYEIDKCLKSSCKCKYHCQDVTLQNSEKIKVTCIKNVTLLGVISCKKNHNYEFYIANGNLLYKDEHNTINTVIRNWKDSSIFNNYFL